jgi:N-methylhydantoinase A
LERAFHARHRQLYGYATAEPCIIEALRVQARKPSTTRITRPHTTAPPKPARIRPCTFDGVGEVPTDILDRETLSHAVAGPAIIEDAWSTIVVPPKWRATPKSNGSIMLTEIAA